MLVERIKKFYDVEYDLNCAETIIYAANEEYDLNLSKDALKTMAAFGGGMAIESVCGAATGAIAVIGIMFTEISGHKSPRVKELTQEFMSEFEKALGTLECDKLKEEYREDEVRCLRMVETAGKILEDIITREKR
ncbi:MAG: hypothetical protein E7214_11435 [Clostridium sp.]|nr:hypothetical protein [Clostridium sp.]